MVIIDPSRSPRSWTLDDPLAPVFGHAPIYDLGLFRSVDASLSSASTTVYIARYMGKRGR